jgi:hypothetical protein
MTLLAFFNKTYTNYNALSWVEANVESISWIPNLDTRNDRLWNKQNLRDIFAVISVQFYEHMSRITR